MAILLVAATATASAETLWLPGASFTSSDGIWSPDDLGYFVNRSGRSAFWRAHVALPHGAVITEIEIFVGGNGSNAAPVVRLVRFSDDGSGTVPKRDVVRSVSGAGARDYERVRLVADTQIDLHDGFDDEVAYYVIELEMPGAVTGKFKALRISWQRPSRTVRPREGH